MTRVKITYHEQTIEKVPVGESPVPEVELEDGAYIGQARLSADYQKPNAKTVTWRLFATIITPV